MAGFTYNNIGYFRNILYNNKAVQHIEYNGNWVWSWWKEGARYQLSIHNPSASGYNEELKYIYLYNYEINTQEDRVGRDKSIYYGFDGEAIQITCNNASSGLCECGVRVYGTTTDTEAFVYHQDATDLKRMPKNRVYLTQQTEASHDKWVTLGTDKDTYYNQDDGGSHNTSYASSPFFSMRVPAAKDYYLVISSHYNTNTFGYKCTVRFFAYGAMIMDKAKNMIRTTIVLNNASKYGDQSCTLGINLKSYSDASTSIGTYYDIYINDTLYYSNLFANGSYTYKTITGLSAGNYTVKAIPKNNSANIWFGYIDASASINLYIPTTIGS